MPTKKFRTITINYAGGQMSEFKIFPSAERQIKHDVRLAMAKQVIRGEYERDLAERALLAAAIEKAAEDRTRFVTVHHVKAGWRDKVSYAPKVCIPAKKCLKRSVIDRAEELRNRSEVFRVMLSQGG